MYIHVLRYVKDIILHTYQHLLQVIKKKMQINKFLPAV